ncbi:hypothetical protein IW262DRAFT_1375843 [Armillaria fumosa]|nr:hypothetical protein IW262DRAFT_1375843 [Armillaria fumosa]
MDGLASMLSLALNTASIWSSIEMPFRKRLMSGEEDNTSITCRVCSWKGPMVTPWARRSATTAIFRNMRAHCKSSSLPYLGAHS